MSSDALNRLNRALSGEDGKPLSSSGEDDKKSGKKDPRQFFGEQDARGKKLEQDVEYERDDETGEIKTNKDGSPRKKRGRRAGTKAPKEKSSGKSKGSLDTIANALTGIHWILASWTKIEELTMTEEEAKVIASSINDVVDAFDIPRNEKVEAVVALGVVLSNFYGSKYLSYKARILIERKKAEQARNAPPRPVKDPQEEQRKRTGPDGGANVTHIFTPPQSGEMF